MSDNPLKTLPSWLKLREQPGHVEVDPDGFYPYFMERLGFTTVDKYTLEVCYQCMKLEVQLRLSLADLDPRKEMALVIHVKGSEGHKDRWGQAGKPEGLRESVKSRLSVDKKLSGAPLDRMADKVIGLEAKNLYKSLRSVLPQ